MRIKLDKQLKSMTGEVMTETYLKNGNQVTDEITVAVVLRAALTQPIDGDTRKDKELDFIIISKILTAEASQVELNSDEISRLKDKIYKMYDSWISGCMDLILEGKELPV